MTTEHEHRLTQANRALLEENVRLREELNRVQTTMQQVLVDAQAQDVLPEWWPMMEAALMGSHVKVSGAEPLFGEASTSSAEGATSIVVLAGTPGRKDIK